FLAPGAGLAGPGVTRRVVVLARVPGRAPVPRRAVVPGVAVAGVVVPRTVAAPGGAGFLLPGRLRRRGLVAGPGRRLGPGRAVVPGGVLVPRAARAAPGRGVLGGRSARGIRPEARRRGERGRVGGPRGGLRRARRQRMGGRRMSGRRVGIHLGGGGSVRGCGTVRRRGDGRASTGKEGLVVVAITVTGAGTGARGKSACGELGQRRAITHRQYHIVKRELVTVPMKRQVNDVGGVAIERLTACGALCCIKACRPPHPLEQGSRDLVVTSTA